MEMKRNLNAEWTKILGMENCSPYLFRTRLERTINHSIIYARETKNASLQELGENIKCKLKYISDQSNQTSDGMLNSYLILKIDMNKMLSHVS